MQKWRRSHMESSPMVFQSTNRVNYLLFLLVNMLQLSFVSIRCCQFGKRKSEDYATGILRKQRMWRRSNVESCRKHCILVKKRGDIFVVRQNERSSNQTFIIKRSQTTTTVHDDRKNKNNLTKLVDWIDVAGLFHVTATTLPFSDECPHRSLPSVTLKRMEPILYSVYSTHTWEDYYLMSASSMTCCIFYLD